ncbi:ArdC family protein [Pseudomonas amygdali]|uniref:ArdC family protein n=1 Tax=Pseudomonas amygdali TaxID=47877 RepID=UPI0006E60C4A|nr:zincin-like metallopeptidase domain-containing protein [Pseudomonas amygdali]KPY55720.1 hypothetical protein ALO93_200039 [Pseudomonas amygdali pv. sesami]
MAREDFRQRITNALIQNVESVGALPWAQGWPQMEVRPFNPGTGEKYKGGNVLNLMLEQVRRGSDDPRWMTLAQANDAGLRIRQNAKAAHVEYWEFEWSQPKSEDGSKAAKGPDYGRRQGRVLYAPVFNGADIVGIPAFKRSVSWNPNELVERLIQATGVKIKHSPLGSAGASFTSNPAAYSNESDVITVPPRESFAREGDYYASVIHQLAKWTGHHSRLNRPAPDESQPLGSPVYAREEFRAEVASLFLNSMLGVAGSAVENHATYASGWLQMLKGDKHEVYRAARDAEKIVEHLFSYAPELRELVERQLVESTLPAAEQQPAVLGSGIKPGLPNFIPAQLEQVGRGSGRSDPRWLAFAETVRAEAVKVGVSLEVVEGAMNMVEPQFSEVMDAAKSNGYSASEMNDMFARSIIDEMRTADLRQQQWEKFCAQAHESGRGAFPAERIELALQELGCQYQAAIEQSTNENWSREATDAAIHSVIFGDKGRRPISAEYVAELVGRSGQVREAVLPTSESHDLDDVVLSPIGLAELSDEQMAGAGEGSNRSLMHDAEYQYSNGP